MLLTNRSVRLLFEAVEDAGIEKEELTRPLGLDAGRLLSQGGRVEWTTLVDLAAQLSRVVEGDEVRLRDIGRRMVWTRSYGPFRRIGRNLVSVRSLYRVAERWILSVNLPHLRTTLRFVSDSRIHARCAIPDGYAECKAFFQIGEGTAVAIPEVVGLPPAVVVTRTLTARSMELVIDLPARRPIRVRARQAIRALLDAPTTLATLEDQRRELSGNIQALQTARDELRVLLDRLPDLVAVHAAGAIVWVNRAFVVHLGYESATEIVGMNLLDLVAPQCRHRAMERMSRTLDAPDVAPLTEWVLRARTGEDVMVELAPTQSVVFDGVAARLLVGRDVTERVRMQQTLLVADRLASVGLLAAGVAHEVNNPLAYILNNIEIARKELAGIGDAAELSRQVLSTALEGVDRIRVIVRDLLLLSRGDDATLAMVDVCAVASSTLALAAREVERTAHLVQDLGPAPLVLASGARISQVLLNLVGNALEAMSGRPREDNELVVRIKQASDSRLLLEVSDTGNGIAEPDLSRVFEPFFTTKPAGRGTGLGLAIAQRMVVEMGGEISVVSTVGRGTTFRVLLPQAPVPPSSPSLDRHSRESAT